MKEENINEKMDKLEEILDMNDKLIENVKNKLQGDFLKLVQKYK